MIESLFGEMTVLGFLSVFTFVISKMHFFPELSKRLFGEEEEEQLLEIFEFVHYTLFFVMIFFVIQVLGLEKQGIETMAQWEEMDRASQDKEYMKAIRERYDSGTIKITSSFRSALSAVSSASAYLPLLRNVKRELLEDQLMFHTLRKEFIMDRSNKPPFHPRNDSNGLSDDFRFGSYLSVCLGNTLAHIVEVEEFTWVFFAAVAVFAFTIFIASGDNMVVLAWVWVALGWSALVFNINFEKHLAQVRAAFASLPKRGSILKGDLDEKDVSNGESTYLIPLRGSDNGYDDLLPNWCKIDMDDYMDRKRSWFNKILNGPGIPERHQTLFWFEKKGPHFCMLIVQINLVFTGVYSAMLLLTFFGSMYDEASTAHFASFVVAAVLPVMVIMGNKKHLVALMAQVTCIGMFRRHPVISDVIREEKTHRAIRTFVVLCKMNHFAERGDWNHHKVKKRRSSIGGGIVHYSKSFDKLEISEISKTFDTFDRSGDGQISTAEFEALMKKMGIPLEAETLHNMIAMFDTDGDGEVSKEEFLQWYADSMKEDDLSTKQKAHFLFRVFDNEGSGKITIAEFKDTLDALDIGFTFDEISDIVRELDHDGNGTIGEHEFEDLLLKYYPKELYYEIHQQMKAR